MGQLEEFKKLNAEALASCGTSPSFGGFSSATLGSECPSGKVQMQSL